MAGHVFAGAGRCLQVVVKQSNLWQSPTGQSAKGLKTRDNKRTDKFIVRRRKKRK